MYTPQEFEVERKRRLNAIKDEFLPRLAQASAELDEEFKKARAKLDEEFEAEYKSVVESTYDSSAFSHKKDMDPVVGKPKKWWHHLMSRWNASRKKE